MVADLPARRRYSAALSRYSVARSFGGGDGNWDQGGESGDGDGRRSRTARSRSLVGHKAASLGMTQSYPSYICSGLRRLCRPRDAKGNSKDSAESSSVLQDSWTKGAKLATRLVLGALLGVAIRQGAYLGMAQHNNKGGCHPEPSRVLCGWG
jgi:hypothetical protein